MQWEVSGASRETGKELAYIIEADTEASAIRRGNRQGMLVSSARPLDPEDSVVAAVDQPAAEEQYEPEPAQEYEQEYQEEPQYQEPVPAVQYVYVQQTPEVSTVPACPFCGARVRPRRVQKGSLALAMMLTFCAILPGIIYIIFGYGFQYVCPKCGVVRGPAA